jgi:sphingomyelin phosphodiesterase 2
MATKSEILRATPDEISILSLNCWSGPLPLVFRADFRGLKWLSKHCEVRLDAIADRIASASYDIVALQEIWAFADFENLVEKTRHLLPYAKFYFSGALGGGMAILSKWPMESTTMWRYPLNGRPTAFWRGDWYVGKGVAIASIRHSSGAIIEVFNTHVEPQMAGLTVDARTVRNW